MGCALGVNLRGAKKCRSDGVKLSFEWVPNSLLVGAQLLLCYCTNGPLQLKHCFYPSVFLASVMNVVAMTIGCAMHMPGVALMTTQPRR